MNKPVLPALSPRQAAACAALKEMARLVPAARLEGNRGSGISLILAQAAIDFGAVTLSYHDFLAMLSRRDPLALEETFYEWVGKALDRHETVILDHVDFLGKVVVDEGCFGGSYPRRQLLTLPLFALIERCAHEGRHLVFGGGSRALAAIHRLAPCITIDRFEHDDYEHICRQLLGERQDRLAPLEFRRIHRFARRLDGYQLRKLAAWVHTSPSVSTDDALDFLRRHGLHSNVDLPEVQPVDLSELRGVDDVRLALEANIILPLENDELAERLQLRPKRGVLLAGPPGTGKTTVGRALAHRLRSKFFLIDGTCIQGTSNFYQNVANVFEEAQENAPSIIFIDDSDVIFEDGDQSGLYRYLLTMLDGLESESASQVCVMLTAMDVGNIPPALLRSGRVELWLEMRLPDAAARGEILAARLKDAPAEVASPNIAAVQEATEGFTGADLKRLVEDARLLYALDVSKGLPLREVTRYYLDAVDIVQQNKEHYAAAEAKARERSPRRPSYYHTYAPDEEDYEDNGDAGD